MKTEYNKKYNEEKTYLRAKLSGLVGEQENSDDNKLNNNNMVTI